MMTGKRVDAATTARTPLVDESDSDIRFDLPSYLKSLVFRRPSLASDADRQSVKFRCRRMRGILNLYSWAMAWTIHDANDWQLGVEPRPFTLNTPCLSLMGIETLGDIPREWDEIAKYIGIPKVGGFGQSGLVQIEDFRWDDENDTLKVQPTSRMITNLGVDDETGEGNLLEPSDLPTITFDQDDLVTCVHFAMYGTCPHCQGQVLTTSRNSLCSGCSNFEDIRLIDAVYVDLAFGENHQFIPWFEITGELQAAFRSLEPHLKAERINWTAPPYFRRRQFGIDLLNDIDLRREDPQIVLADLEQSRKKHEDDVNSILRTAVNREHPPSDPPPPTGATATYMGKRKIEVADTLVKLTSKYHVNTLEYLVEHRSADTMELKTCTSNPSTTMKQLCELRGGILAPFLTMPGKEHKGEGYSTTIIDGRGKN